MLFAARACKDSAEEIEDAITPNEHAIEKRDTRNYDLLLRCSIVFLRTIELDFANIGDTPGIAGEFSHGILLFIDTDKVPSLETSLAGPGHCDRRVGIRKVKRAVGIHSAESFLG